MDNFDNIRPIRKSVYIISKTENSDFGNNCYTPSIYTDREKAIEHFVDSTEWARSILVEKYGYTILEDDETKFFAYKNDEDDDLSWYIRIWLSETEIR